MHGRHAPGEMGYRQDIDGLRAVAVLAVVGYHYALPGASGGFVGVDVFFVISGFLITGVLRRQIAAGTFTIGAFYARRARRILPALLVVLGVSLAAGHRLLMPGDYVSLGESAAYAAGGAGNLFFVAHTGYFDRAADLQPLLHTWSLGVEEQFYLVWPFLLAGATRLFGRWPIAVVAGIVGLAVASFAWSLILMSTAPAAAFFLTHVRAWELAAGAVVSFLPAISARRPGALAGGLGLLLIAIPAVTLTAADSFPGWNAVPAVAGAALLVWPRSGDATTRLLSRPFLRHIGQISYSLYLWHWPLLVFYRHFNSGQMPDAPTRCGLALVAYCLAVASWHLVEQPCRRVTLRPRVVLMAAAAAMVGVVALGATVWARQGFPQRIGRAFDGMESLALMWEWQCPRTVDIPGFGAVCNFGRPWHTAATRGLLWGDSHAEHMAPIVEAAIADRDVAFLLLLPCPAAYDDDVRREWPAMPDYPQQCADKRRHALALAQTTRGLDLVILSSAWRGATGVTSARPRSNLPADGAQLIEIGLARLFDAAAAPGRRFLLLGQVPEFPGDPVPCLAGAEVLWRRGCDTVGQRMHEFYAKRQSAIDARFERMAARRNDVTAILPGRRLCADGSCLTRLDGEPLYRDGGHLRRNLSAPVWRRYAEAIGLADALDDAMPPEVTRSRAAR